VSLNLRNIEISEAMEMIAKQRHLNILLGENVTGQVSLNLYKVSVDNAIRSITAAAGFAVEKRDKTYFLMQHVNVGRYSNGDITRVRKFNINYADPILVGEVLQQHLSQYGKLTVVADRNLVLVTDKPEFLQRIEQLVGYVDAQPQQVLIEAQILEVTLSDEDSYGIDWANLFASDGGDGRFGTQGLSGPGDSSNLGFLFSLMTPNVDIALTALEQEGRVRTLSTPKLLALDNQEASVIIGDRRGYQVTTTINQVTTESIEFLESGVILRVTPHIDANGRVLMDIHPEVSTGTVDANGIPSQTTTEVETSLLVPDNQTVFIGGLMKHTVDESYQRVPVLGRMPILKRLFSNRERGNVTTETVVLITPRIVTDLDSFSAEPASRVRKERDELQDKTESIERRVDDVTWPLFELNRPIEPLAAVTPAAPAVADLSPDLYTVQLMTMVNQQAMARYLDTRSMVGLRTVQIESGGKERVALLLDVYATAAIASEAAIDLPAQFADKKPWVRPLRDVQAEMLLVSARTNPAP
jgi:type II secretory pathway component GspD/PulD (secretin)